MVVGCLGNSKQNVKAGELALRLHFEAEHSNVLLVTAELLNGCLTTCEVVYMDMALHQYDDKMVSCRTYKMVDHWVHVQKLMVSFRSLGTVQNGVLGSSQF